jgi:hypothetical protein
MTNFFDANVHLLPQEITNCVRVEPYNFNTKYVIAPRIGMSTIPNSNNVDAQKQILPTHEYHSSFQKKDNECHLIIDDAIVRKKQNPNEPLHLFFIKGVGTCSGKKFFQELFKEGHVCSIIPLNTRDKIFKNK